MLTKILCTLVAGGFAALLYTWGDVLDHQLGGETWVFRIAIAIGATVAGAYFIRLEDRP